MDRPSATGSAIDRRLLWAAMLLLVPVMTWPAIARGVMYSPAADDQIKGHWPAIVALVEFRPQTAAGPGALGMLPTYHAAMAAIVLATGAGARTIQAVGSLIGVGLVALVLRVATKHTTPGTAALLTLPFAVSTYVLTGSVWIGPDDAGWLCALGTLALLLDPDAPPPRRLIGAGLLAALAVSIRQVQIWLCAPLLYTAAVAWRDGDRVERARWVRAAVLALAAPALVGLWIVARWHGIAPPGVQQIYTGAVNPTAVVFMLGLCGAFGVMFVPLAGQVPRSQWPAMLMSGAAACAIALVVKTDSAFRQGRWGGPLWRVVEVGPTVRSHSLLLIVLVTLGGMAIARLALAASAAGQARRARLLAVALAAFVVAHLVVPRLFERYFDPLLLALLAWFTALALPSGAHSRPGVALLLLAAAAEAALSIVMIYFHPAIFIAR